MRSHGQGAGSVAAHASHPVSSGSCLSSGDQGLQTGDTGQRCLDSVPLPSLWHSGWSFGMCSRGHLSIGHPMSCGYPTVSGLYQGSSLGRMSLGPSGQNGLCWVTLGASCCEGGQMPA